MNCVYEVAEPLLPLISKSGDPKELEKNRTEVRELLAQFFRPRLQRSREPDPEEIYDVVKRVKYIPRKALKLAMKDFPASRGGREWQLSVEDRIQACQSIDALIIKDGEPRSEAVRKIARDRKVNLRTMQRYYKQWQERKALHKKEGTRS